MRFNSHLVAAVVFVLAVAACDKEEAVIPVVPGDPDVVTIGGTEYATVTIGSLTWTAVNHAGAGGIQYDAANSKPEYGKYYTYEEVKSIVLPQGWRIPTMKDYEALAAGSNVTIPSHLNVDIKALTSTSNWRNVSGTNASGFNAHPGGYSFNGSLPIDGDIAEFWTNEGNTLSIQEAVNNTMRIMFYGGSNEPIYRFNVRFVKDQNP